ncbi:MAG: response regulator [Candidatus Omnitrophica bacterium]|nr:response regulator [Candidatus Omnitrophota bacterium]
MACSIKILAVDDEQGAREFLNDLFSKKGYDIETVSTGADALTAIDRVKPDIVLLDIGMPGMDGTEVLSRIKQKCPLLPVIMLTAYGYDDNLINKAMKLGSIGYINKNLPLAQIINTFQVLLSTVPKKYGAEGGS